MKKLTRRDLQLLARHSDLNAAEIEEILRTTVYAGLADWRRLLRRLLLGLGAAFLLSGVLFFFAYNWEALHKFVKIGSVGVLLTATAVYGSVRREKTLGRRMAITAATVLIGVLFAVLGQVYQTGADSFDLFLAWAVFALPWVAVVDFAPLGLLFVVLLNLTLVTYSQQVGIDLPFVATGVLLFSLNVVSWLVIRGVRGRAGAYDRLLKVVALWATIVITVNISAGAVAYSEQNLTATLLAAVTVFAGWTWYGLRLRELYYPAVAGAGTIVSFAFLLLRNDSVTEIMFFTTGLVIVVSITLLVAGLNRLNKQWQHERK